MAPAKQQWTAEHFLRLRQAMTYIMFGAIIFLLLTTILFFVGIGFEDEMFLPLFGLWLAVLLPTIGFGKIRRIFTEMAFDADPSLKPQASQPFQQKVSKPQATVKTSQDDVAMRSQQQLDYLTSLKKQASKKSQPAVKMDWGKSIDWEEWIGKKLLQKAGVLIVLIGMLVLLKYSFDNRWIDEMGRLVLSVIAAALLLGAGEWFHAKYAKWAQAFTGGGIALLYLTVWIAHVFYAQPLAVNYGLVVPAGVAFALYGFITLIGALASVRYKAQTIAWFTVLGGYLTPFLVDSPSPNITALLLYLAVLAGGLILLAWHQKWRYINAAAFLLTQFYLFTAVYVTVPELGDVQQVVIASAFFLLFNILPLLYQFRLKMKADIQDIFLIIANAVAVFLPVVDALGGWESGYIGIACFALAAFYLLFSAAALNKRGEDASLVNTYLVGTVILVAAGLFAELEREWVAVGWAPLSLLLGLMSMRIPRKGLGVCSFWLLAGSLFFLGINMPAFTATAETIWRPFTSDWAIQSYVVFAVIAAWIRIASKLPQAIMGSMDTAWMKSVLHTCLAVILFLAFTFEATKLDFTVDLQWTAAYIALGVVSIAVFYFAESLVWFAAAFVAQLLALLFIFAFGESSGMVLSNGMSVAPFMHPWGYLSMVALIASLVMIYVARLKNKTSVSGMRADVLLITLALAQIWVHVSVEIMNMREAYGIPMLTADRMLTGWWIVFALAALAYATLKKKEQLTPPVLLLFAIPFAHNHIYILMGADRMPETMVWTLLSLSICVTAARLKWNLLLRGGIILLLLTAGIDMITHLGDSTAGLVRSSWWALAGLVTMIAGFMEREKVLRQMAMLIFGATALKLLFVDFNGLATPVRIGASIVTGLLMIGASYLYQRFDTAAKPATVPLIRK